MIVKLSLETPAGMKWECVFDTDEHIIFKAVVENDKPDMSSIQQTEVSTDDPDAMEFVWVLVAELFDVTDCDVYGVTVDGIGMSDEWLEAVHDGTLKRGGEE